MGDDRIVSRWFSSPMRQGQVPLLTQAAAANLANSGGSAREMNEPSRTASRVWTAAMQ